MYKRQFKMIGRSSRELKVYAENYMNAMEVAQICRTRPLNNYYERHDYFVNKDRPNNPSWSGFKDREDLINKCTLGVKDAKMVNSIQKYAHKAVVEEKDRYARTTLDVCGGGVNVPLLLSGSPVCMYSRKKAPVRSKIINMGLHCEVTCEIFQNDYMKAGMLVAQLVSKLEKAGYRIRMNTMDAFYASCDPNITVLTTVVKRENEPMNYARLLYPLTNVSYSRGVGFAWAARNPDFTYKPGLGTYVESAFDSDEKSAKVDELFEKCTGLKGFTSFKIKDIINMMYHKGDDATLKFMESRLMSSIQ